jgi:predicted dehydrogenase
MKRIALVGFGKFAPRHLEVLRAQGAEIVAVCNRSEAGRARAMADGGIPKAYASIAELLREERPDGVVCTTPPEAIHEAGMELLASGVPTLLEKPPGISLAQLGDLERQAATHGTPVMVGVNRRHYSVVRRAIDDAGGLDQITGVFIDWSEDPRLLLGRGLPASTVALSTFRNSIHGLDLLVYLAGAPARSSIVSHSFGEPFRWLCNFQGVSERGVVMTFTSTWNAPGRWQVQFVTSDRRYVFAPLETCRVLEAGKNEERRIEPDEADQRFKAGMFGQARSFLEMIETRRVPPAYGLEATRPSMEIAEQLTGALRADL